MSQVATNKSETSWEDQLRAACIERQGARSLRALAIELGIDYAQLHRFMAGQQSLGIGTAEKIATELGFELRMVAAKNLK
jgi:plasmid maintenance system antidote protein VapI